MFDGGDQFIHEVFEQDRVSPAELDALLAKGWRHFGKYFFRYNIGLLEFDIRSVIALRIRLAEFSHSKAQRRNLRRNADLSIAVEPLDIDVAAESLFHRHKQRFDHSIPNSIFDFLSPDPHCPAETLQIRVTLESKLVAVSYFVLGERSASGVYAMFEPEFSNRGLGILTLLKEIEYASALGKEFYYLGYCYSGSSFYDYKKRFRATEALEWNSGWVPYTPEIEAAAPNFLLDDLIRSAAERDIQE